MFSFIFLICYQLANGELTFERIRRLQQRHRLIDYEYNLQCDARNVTQNSILYHLQYGTLGRPQCSTEGATTSTHMTPSGLNQYLKKLKKNKCTLVMFYSTSCPFSISAAPVFNALPTLFPSGLIVAAIEAPRKWTIEHGPGPAEFGVLGTPSIILFYGRKEIARYNDSVIELKRLYEWTKASTKLKPVALDNYLEEDLTQYVEPVPTVLVETRDIGLIISIFALGSVLTVKYSPTLAQIFLR